MNKFALSASLALLLSVPLGAAHANCEHYEFAELKAMDAGKLKLNYCLNAIEMRMQKSRQETAGKLIDLEFQNPSGVSRREIDENKRNAQRASEKSDQCFHENERIVSVLGQQKKKFNFAALMSECPYQKVDSQSVPAVGSQRTARE